MQKSFWESHRNWAQNQHFCKLTKREELSFRAVLALPKASKIGLVCTIWSSSDAFLAEPFFSPRAPTKAKYEMTFFVFSVLPAPDSPLKWIEKISWKIRTIQILMETTTHVISRDWATLSGKSRKSLYNRVIERLLDRTARWPVSFVCFELIFLDKWKQI